MIGQETPKGSLVLHRRKLLAFLYQMLRTRYQVVQTGNIVTHLNLKLSLAIEPFNKEAILFFMNRDAFHSDLIQHLTHCAQDACITECGPHCFPPKILEIDTHCTIV